MSNIDRAAGFAPVSQPRLDTLRWLPIDLASGDLFRGDAAVLVADYGVDQVAAGGDAIYGIALGFRDSAGTPLLFYDDSAYSTEQCEALVCTDPEQLYVIQDDGAGSPAATWIGNNADLVVGTGNGTNGQSAMEVGAASVATTAALQVLIVDWVRADDNSPASDYCNWVVKINQPQFSDLTSTGIAGV